MQAPPKAGEREREEVLSVRIPSEMKRQIAALQTRAGFPTLGDAARSALMVGLSRMSRQRAIEPAE